MAKKTKVTIEQLKAAAEDFNSFMEFEEPEGIPFDDMDYEELVEEISQTAEELESEDTITQATSDTLLALGVDFEATISDEEDEEETEEEEVEEDDELPTDAEIRKMKKTELIELAEELKVDIDGLSVAKIKVALIEALDTEEEEEVEEEEEEEVEEEAIPLKGKEAKAVKEAIAAVKKSRKLDDVKAIAKENGIRMPPPFLDDLKKLKPYVTGKLEDILSGEVKVKKAAKKKTSKPVDISKSNKAIVWKAWDKGETEVEKLLEAVDNNVKASTIKNWISGWAKGNNLPAIANQK